MVNDNERCSAYFVVDGRASLRVLGGALKTSDDFPEFVVPFTQSQVYVVGMAQTHLGRCDV